MSIYQETSHATRPVARGMRRYLVALVGASLSILFLFLMVAWSLSYDDGIAHDYFSEIARDGDPGWYRNFGGRHVPQIQDQDIFYSNVGSSVASAKSADIIFLGPSFVSYAVDRDTLRAAPSLGPLKIYNMAFVGIRGGEFSRRIITRWKIHAPLWVINVDDQFVNFFSSDLNVTLGPEKILIDAVKRNRLRSYLTVIGRDLRWRIEDAVAAYWNKGYSDSGLYRSVTNGDMSLAVNPAYLGENNKPMLSTRNQNCHTTPEIIEYAGKFLKDAGGQVVLTLVPHSQSCLGQVTELAKALNVELIAPPFDGLTTVDGGGHLDKKGAEIFTRYLAGELVKTKAFKQAFGAKLGGSN